MAAVADCRVRGLVGASPGSRGWGIRQRFVRPRPPPSSVSTSSPEPSSAARARLCVVSASPAACRRSSVDTPSRVPSCLASAAITASSSRAGPRARLCPRTDSSSCAFTPPSHHGPRCANLSLTVLACPRPSRWSTTTINPPSTSQSRAARYALRPRPARAAAAGVPGHAGCSEFAKLASENATSRSLVERSSLARTAAIAFLQYPQPDSNRRSPA